MYQFKVLSYAMDQILLTLPSSMAFSPHYKMTVTTLIIGGNFILVFNSEMDRLSPAETQCN